MCTSLFLSLFFHIGNTTDQNCKKEYVKLVFEDLSAGYYEAEKLKCFSSRIEISINSNRVRFSDKNGENLKLQNDSITPEEEEKVAKYLQNMEIDTSKVIYTEQIKFATNEIFEMLINESVDILPLKIFDMANLNDYCMFPLYYSIKQSYLRYYFKGLTEKLFDNSNCPDSLFWGVARL